MYLLITEDGCKRVRRAGVSWEKFIDNCNLPIVKFIEEGKFSIICRHLKSDASEFFGYHNTVYEFSLNKDYVINLSTEDIIRLTDY